jgi:nucleotide-binding universal stress UspA family protein
VVAATLFPWPRHARPTVVIARGGGPFGQRWGGAESAVEDALRRVATDARRRLARRWPDADIVIVDQPPVEAILRRARALGAQAIVLGFHGHSALSRTVLGSVSRGVVRRGACAVLVVKGRPRQMRHFVLAFDGSPTAQRTLAFVQRLEVPADGEIMLSQVVEPIRPPSAALLPASVRQVVLGEAAAAQTERVRAAERALERATRPLERRGWRIKTTVRTGVPLDEILRAVAEARADALLLGARGVGVVERILLGSVAEGMLARSPVSALIVR